MRKLSILTLFTLSLCASTTAAPSSDTEAYSYAIGYNIGKQMAYQFDNEVMPIDRAKVLEAIEDALNNKEKMSIDEINQALQAMNTAKEKRLEEEAANNLKKGEAFLKEHAKKEGVVTTESGLQYRIITKGTGAKPTANDSVTVHYHGTLIDGTVFDSSVERGEPVTFGVTQVIAGWQEALQLMSEGSKWQVVIPSDLAYGNRGAGAIIKPNATLVFEIDLLKVNK